MSKFLIKIDRNSIKENEDAGSTNAKICLGSDIDVTIRTKHQNLEEVYPDNFRRTSYRKYSLFIEESHYKMLGKEEDIASILEKLVKKFKKDILYNVNFNYQDVNFLVPVSKYRYEYLKTEIECIHCKAKFNHKDLIDDMDEDSEGNMFGTANGCPVCKESHCCELEFEKFNEDMLKESCIK